MDRPSKRREKMTAKQKAHRLKHQLRKRFKGGNNYMTLMGPLKPQNRLENYGE